MNSRSCRWLIVSALLITASGAWAQRGRQHLIKRTSPSQTASYQRQRCGAMQPGGDVRIWQRCAPGLCSGCALVSQGGRSGQCRRAMVLGDLYDIGHGVPQDYAQAAFWFRKAAEQGDAEAQYDLGDLYDEGQGVPQDYAQAAAWYRKAAAWYRKAAEQGDAERRTASGFCTRSGQGVPQDYAQAAALVSQGGGAGRRPAQYVLGSLYDRRQRCAPGLHSSGALVSQGG